MKDAKTKQEQAIILMPTLSRHFWNAAWHSKTVKGAEYWIKKCLISDPNHQALNGRLRLSFIKEKRLSLTDYRNLSSGASYMRSLRGFSAYQPCPNYTSADGAFLIVLLSIITRPFYEFGVWQAWSFKYLIKFSKKAMDLIRSLVYLKIGFLGSHVEEKGTYSSDGNVPDIEGGEFIAGEFEDTLPVFFSEQHV